MSEGKQIGWDGGNGVYHMDHNGHPVKQIDGQPVPDYLKPREPISAEPAREWQVGCSPVRRKPRAGA